MSKIKSDQRKKTNYLFLHPNFLESFFYNFFDEHQDYILITIYSMKGQQLIQKEFFNVNAIDLEIDSADGIYFVELNNGITNIARLKVIKE